MLAPKQERFLTALRSVRNDGFCDMRRNLSDCLRYKGKGGADGG